MANSPESVFSELVSSESGRRLFACAVLLFVSLMICSPLVSRADEALFEKDCGVCHTLDPEQPRRQGPDLKDIIGRKAGSITDFPYSNSVRSLGFDWNAENLDRWLAAPTEMASDTYMMYSQPDADVRRSIIQFLTTQ